MVVYIYVDLTTISLKNNVPCQAVSNKLAVELLPNEFRDLRRLERVLVAKRILFKKVTVMPKGQSPKVKGSMCNIPISEIDNKCNCLPRPADRMELSLSNLKGRQRTVDMCYLSQLDQG